MKPRRPRPSRRPAVPPTPRSVTPATYLVTLGIVMLVGAVVRVVAAQGELWLDEIWSYRTGQGVSWIGVFSDLHSDNNHYLNTLYLRLIPEGTAAWWLYRVPALVFGSASIGLAALIARRRNAVAALAAAVLMASSFMLVVYASEARGYVIAVFFAFAAVLAIDRFFERDHLGWGLAAALCATLGLLGHLTFLHAMAGLMVWAVVRSHRLRRGRLLRDVSVLFALPVLVLTVLYGLDLRFMKVGGGPLVPAAETAVNALAIALGGYAASTWTVATALLALGAALASIVAVRRAGSDLWILLLVTVVIAPLITVMVVGTGVIYERYLLVAVAFMTLSFAWLIERIAIGRPLVAGLLLAAFVVSNAHRTWSFAAAGRSQYQAALTHVIARSPAGVISIGSDHDFRNGRMVDFYRAFTQGGDRFLYEMRGSWGPGGPEWLLAHSFDPAFEPRAEEIAEGLYGYRLERFYPSGGMSGWHLALYRRADGSVAGR